MSVVNETACLLIILSPITQWKCELVFKDGNRVSEIPISAHLWFKFTLFRELKVVSFLAHMRSHNFVQ